MTRSTLDECNNGDSTHESIQEMEFLNSYNNQFLCGGKSTVTSAAKCREITRRDVTSSLSQSCSFGIPLYQNGFPSYNKKYKISNLCDDLGSIELSDDTRRPEDISSLDLLSTRKDKDSKYQETENRINSELVIVQDNDGDTFIHTGIILKELSHVLLYINFVSSQTWLDIKNYLTQTPLHLSVITNQSVIVRRLIVGGANIESRDKQGNTALHLACQKGYLEIVESLLEPVRYSETKQNGYEISYQKIPQNLEIVNYEGLNCLHIAVINGHKDIVELLIDKGVDVNSKDIKTGRTILHTASLNGKLQLVKLLLRHKSCNINARAYDGYTPFDFARIGGNKQIIIELAVAGAQYGESDDEED